MKLCTITGRRYGLDDTNLASHLYHLPASGYLVNTSAHDRAGLLESDRLVLSLGSASPGVFFDQDSVTAEIPHTNSLTRFLVLDCTTDIMLTDVIIPVSTPFSQLTIDTWTISEASKISFLGPMILVNAS